MFPALEIPFLIRHDKQMQGKLKQVEEKKKKQKNRGI